MGLRGITLNTPPEEEAHIIAEDDAAIYQSIFGEDGVFTIGDRMKATVINNNQVRVSNGVICVGGHIARTVYGDYSDMTIENGEISKNRNDIITAVFSTTGEKGIDKFKIEVKKGTPGVVAEDPELTKENLYEGGKLRELPLWRVKLEGINIIGVEQMFKIIHKIPDLEEMIESLNGKSIIESGKNDNGYYRKYADGTLEMWGTSNAIGSQGAVIVTLPQPFIDTVFRMCANQIYHSNTPVSVTSTQVQSKQSFLIYAREPNGTLPASGCKYNWFVTGTWK